MDGLTKMFTKLSLAVVLVAILAGMASAAPHRAWNTTYPRQAQPTGSPSSYKQVAEFTHPNFFDGFTYFDGGDPTLGSITYVDSEAAKAKELVGWVWYEDQQVSNAYVGLDHQGKASHRDSVRLVSKQTFNVGTLTVIDVQHIPTGPALWPAVWFLAPSSEGEWPGAGEMDIMEWVNDRTYNAMTLHTGPGCTVEKDPSSYLGSLENTNCNEGSNNIPGALGCSISAPKSYSVNGQSMATAGPEFNKQGGGVYVHEWTADGIAVWLFPRNDLPADLKAGKPSPKSWTQKPLAKWTGKGCDFSTAFKPQQLVVNIDLCGQWAGNDFPGKFPSPIILIKNFANLLYRWLDKMQRLRDEYAVCIRRGVLRLCEHTHVCTLSHCGP
jgi:hypothetical protein